MRRVALWGASGIRHTLDCGAHKFGCGTHRGHILDGDARVRLSTVQAVRDKYVTSLLQAIPSGPIHASYSGKNKEECEGSLTFELSEAYFSVGGIIRVTLKWGWQFLSTGI